VSGERGGAVFIVGVVVMVVSEYGGIGRDQALKWVIGPGTGDSVVFR
jgi:hypothetical protein